MTFMACAALLTSMIALNSCKSDEPGGNPNLNDGDVVKTEFAISFPSQAVGPNKMPAATVQTNGLTNFQGITGIFLVPFAGQDSIIGTEARLGANIHLAEPLTKANIQDKNSKAKLYPDVAVPLTTGSFLFYAKSAATGDKNAVGSLVLADTANANANQHTVGGLCLALKDVAEFLLDEAGYLILTSCFHIYFCVALKASAYIFICLSIASSPLLRVGERCARRPIRSMK